MRERVTPEVILTHRRQVNAEGHRLTHRRLASIADTEYSDFPESTGRATLLRQAADQLLRTKRSKSQGHPNGKRNYTAQDRRGKGAPRGSARMHGSRPSTAL